MRKYEIKDIEAYRNRKPRGKGKNNLSDEEKKIRAVEYRQKYVQKTVHIPVNEYQQIMDFIEKSKKSFSLFCVDCIREKMNEDKN